jgi:hypothetical protein
MGRAYADGASGSSTWVIPVIVSCPSTAVDQTHSIRLVSERWCPEAKGRGASPKNCARLMT